MSSTDPSRYYEDHDIGETFEVGSHAVTKAEILEFAEQYDPQPFHVDEAAAAGTVFGGLVASGWHTAAVCMRLLGTGPLAETASVAALGVDELRWHEPVRPGDELSLRVETVEKHPESPIPGVGQVDVDVTGFDQDGETVITWTLLGLVERRE